MSEKENTDNLRYQLLGSGIFVLCALLFTFSGVRARDMLTIAGSLIFLLACVVFIIPVVKAFR